MPYPRSCSVSEVDLGQPGSRVHVPELCSQLMAGGAEMLLEHPWITAHKPVPYLVCGLRAGLACRGRPAE